MRRRAGKSAGSGAYARTPLLYFAWASAYIVLSTLAFGLFLDYGPRILWLEIAKGTAFVGVTALILWAVLEQQLRSSEKHEARFHLLVENLPDAVILVRLPARSIVYANSAAIRMFGYAGDELVGESTSVLHVDAEHFARFKASCLDGLAAGDSRRVEYDMRRRNGEVFPASHVMSLFEDDGVTYSISVIRDESERRAYERQIRESEQRLRQIAENLREVLWITDAGKSVVHYANPAYELVWGRSLEELYANPKAFLDAVHPEDRERVAASAARQASEEYDIQYRIQRPDGEVRWIWDRAVPIENDDGTVTRVVGIAEDVTELRRREAELLQAQKMEAVGQLTGGVAHDFNNLLTVILGNAESLRASVSGDSEDAQDLNGIIGAGRRAASLTQRLLAFSRQQILSRDRIDVNELVLEMTELLRRTLGEHIRIETRLDEELWAVTADRSQLETCIMNLALNARDAMPEGGRITLETASCRIGDEPDPAHADLGPGDYVRLRVSDTGVGMTPAVSARIFDPFFTTKEQGKGTGLGLSTVYGFVKQSGGSIGVHSARGEGTRFEVLLPRTSEAQDGPGDRLAGGSAVPRGDEKVLVVEDEPMVRASTVSQLRGLGYMVLDAGSGFEALARLDQHGGVALLVTDVVMPGMSGPELAAAVRRRGDAAAVLFTSGYADAAALDGAGLCAEAAVLRKPYLPRQLGEAVRRAIDRAG